MDKCAKCYSKPHKGGHVYEHGLTVYLCIHCYIVYENLDKKTGNLHNFITGIAKISDVDRNMINARKRRNS